MTKFPSKVIVVTAIATIAFSGLNSARADVDPSRPAAITTASVPRIPRELIARLRQYRSARFATFRGMSPDGRGMLVRTRFGNTSQLCRVYKPAGYREQVTFFDEPVSGTFLPGEKSGPKDKSLVIEMGVGGNERYQIYRFDTDTGHLAHLTDGKSRNVRGAMMHDGSRLAFNSNLRDPKHMDLYVVDPLEPDSRRMIMQVDGMYWIPRDWSPDGSKLLINRYVSINETYPAVFDMKTGKKLFLPIIGKKGKAAYGAMQFSPDGESVYVATDRGTEFHHLVRVGLKRYEYKVLTENIEANVEELFVDHDCKKVAFTVNDDGASALYLLDGDTPRRIDLPVGVVRNLDFSPDGKHLAFTLSQPTAPSDAYSIRLADGKLTRWTFSEVGGLDASKFVKPELIRYKTFDGLKIPAYYFKPRKASRKNRVPVLIKIHGGPESQYRPYFNSVDQFYINELGFAIVQPNVRGSAGYGKAYLKLDNGEKREDSVKDIGALLDWIEKQPELDSSRVAVQGGSYGGYMVLASLVKYGKRIRAGVDVVGVTSFSTFLKNTSPYRQELRRAEYGDERKENMQKFFQRIDPANNADKIRSALLVAHGRNDPRVPFSEAQQIVRNVRRNGGDVWTVYADNEGHGFRRKKNRDYLTAVIALFLKKHLQPAP